MSSKDVTKIKVIHNAYCHYSGRTHKHSLQNASAVQHGVTQPICGAAVKLHNVTLRIATHLIRQEVPLFEDWNYVIY